MREPGIGYVRNDQCATGLVVTDVDGREKPAMKQKAIEGAEAKGQPQRNNAIQGAEAKGQPERGLKGYASPVTHEMWTWGEAEWAAEWCEDEWAAWRSEYHPKWYEAEWSDNEQSEVLLL